MTLWPRLTPADYRWTPPNRRYIAAGFHLPSMFREGIGTIVIGVDTSGSIGAHELEQFAGEISAIAEEAQPESIHVVYCDAAVQSWQQFGPSEPIQLEPKGGKGTDFRPVFEWVEEKQIEPVCLIYLTDLCCHSYPVSPDYPVLWAERLDERSETAQFPIRDRCEPSLQTVRVVSSVAGANSQTCTGLPFGDGVRCSGTASTFNGFTDDVHDSESNLEHTLFRQYSSTQGRFLSPDPYNGSMELGNPQSINRYPYVGGNPVNFADPLGLEKQKICTLLSGGDDEVSACIFVDNFLDPVNLVGSASDFRLNVDPFGNGGIPGTCEMFLPGNCPRSLQPPSIWDLLPHMPQQGCDPGPCGNDDSNGGTSFLQGPGGVPVNNPNFYRVQDIFRHVAQNKFARFYACFAEPTGIDKNGTAKAAVIGAIVGAIKAKGAGGGAAEQGMAF